jgi:DNA-binding NarL/FixJ family response regulator
MHPELILIDASIFDETAWTAITKIKAEWPQTKFVVLTENEQQRQNAQDAGAEILLPKGFPAAKLVALIEDLLIQNTQGETLANSEGGTNAN